MRTLVIGDIHGALRALIQVLERAKYDPMNDRIIFLGDYVDGWSESAEVVQYIIELKKKAELSSVSPDMVITIRGNHDNFVVEWIESGKSNPNWVVQGGAATVESYIKSGLITEVNHRVFFKELLNYYIDDENRAFMHGGYISELGVGHEEYEADYYWDRSMFNTAMSGHSSNKSGKDNLPKLLQPHKEIYIGHTPTINWKYSSIHPAPDGYGKRDDISTPINACNVWNMDTGAGWGDKLTVMDIDTKEFWQSDLTKELYLDEKGR